MPQQSPTPTLRERRKLATRADLVESTLQIVREDGAEAVSVERIARESGMARATLYAHFPDGRDAIVRAAYAELGEQLVANTEAGIDAAKDWRAQLLAVADAMIELAAQPHLGYFYNVAGPALIPDGEGRGGGSGASIRIITEVLQEAMAAGQVASGTDAVATATLLVGSLRSVGIAVASDAGAAPSMRAAFVRLCAGLRS